MLVLTQYISHHELKPLSRFLGIDDVLKGALKVKKGLAIEIRQPVNLHHIRFFKVRVGKKDGGRMIVFMQSEKQSVVPVLIRLKSDKIYGMNMSTNNPAVESQIKANLIHIFDDIRNKDYEEFPLSVEKQG